MSLLRDNQPQQPKLTRQQQAAKLADARTRLAEIDAAIKDRERQRNAATIVFVGGLLLIPALGLGVLIIIYALVRYFAHKGAIKELNTERAALVARVNRMEAALLA